MAEAFARLRGLSIIGFSIYLAFEAAEAPIGPDDSLLSDTLDGIRDVLLVPFGIAIYRLLILGEVTSRYSFALVLFPTPAADRDCRYCSEKLSRYEGGNASR